MSETDSKGQVLYARAEGDVVVVRVEGRGNHELSHTLRSLFEKLNRDSYSPSYIIDLAGCVSLDSTFMGTMAAMALHQTSCRQDRAVVVNTNPTTHRQLDMLGLNYLLDIHTRSAATPGVRDEDFLSAQQQAPSSRFNQIVHMIQAHERLTDISSGNEIKFRGVLDALNESLERESGSQG